MEIRRIAKTALYGAGALGAAHRWRNKDRLTVLMFHRVIAPDHPSWRSADPLYTLSTGFFQRLLELLKRHYSLVSLASLRGARDGPGGLPPCPLLITFDDGWADNYEFAAPLLKAAGVPAVFFLATDAVEQGKAFWQETLVAWTRHGGADEAVWQSALDQEGVGTSAEGAADLSVRGVIRRLEAKGPETVRRFCETLVFSEQDAMPQMMTVRQVQEMCKEPLFTFGAHGASHTPLTQVDDPRRELETSAQRLKSWTGAATDAAVSMSFPHGQYNEEILKAARQTGFDLVFDSVQCLADVGALSGDQALGRFEVRPHETVIAEQGDVMSPADFDAPRIAAEMFFRPHSDVFQPRSS